MGFSVYPDQYDNSSSLPVATDNVTPVKAEVVNRLRDATLSVESELGLQPSGTYSTVRARLDALEAALSSTTGGLGVIGSVLWEGVSILSNVSTLNFEGSAVSSVSSPGSGQVNITVEAPSALTVQEAGFTIGTEITQLNFESGATVTSTGPGLIQIELLGSTVQKQESITVTSNGQTAFTLAQIPQTSNAVEMYVNGLKQQYGGDYTVSGTAVTYVGSISLLTTDKVEFWYLVSGSVSGVGGQTLAETLALGNTTDGYNIILATGDEITSLSGTIPLTGNVDISGDGYIGGKLTVIGLIDPTGLTLTEQSINPGTVVAGMGTVWVRDDVPNVLVFTDDLGSDTVLGAAPPTPALSAVLSTGNTTSGTSIVITSGDTISSSSGPLSLTSNVDIVGDGYISGKLTVAGLIDPTGLTLDEQTANPDIVVAGKGTVWVRNDVPNVLVFTDDLGSDTVLGAAPPTPVLSTVLAAGNTTGGTNISFTSGDAISLASIDTTAFAIGFASTATSDGGDIMITGQLAAAGGAGGGISISAGDAGDGGNGGTALITGGKGGTGTAPGGDANLIAGGGGVTAGNGGRARVQSGSATTSGNGGSLTLAGGNAAGSGSSGIVSLNSGDADTIGNSGDINIYTGNAGSVSGDSGNISISTGTPSDGNGGGITVSAADGVGTDRDGGAISFTAGAGVGTGTPGAITLTAGAGFSVSGADITLTAGGSNDYDGGNVHLIPGAGGIFGALGKIILDGYTTANGNVINNVADPIVDSDVVNKGYLNAAITASSLTGATAINATLSTTSTSLTNIYTYTFDPATSSKVYIEIIGRDSTTGDTAGYTMSAIFENTGGTIAQVGSTSVITQDEEAAAFDAAIITDGSIVEIQIANANANTTDWRAVGHYIVNA